MNYIDLIEPYLDGELSANERSAFDLALEADSELRKEFELRKGVNEAVQDADVLELRITLKDIHRKESKKGTEGIVRKLFANRITQLAAAAVAILIITSLAISNFSKPTLTSDELYSMYYQPDDAVMIMRSGESEQNNILMKALFKYEQEDYEGALQLFKKDESNLIVHFYSGLAYMEIEKFDEAISSFRVIIDNNDNLFIEQAQWYQALCYLKSNETEKAKNLFHSLENSNSIYKNKAELILSSLKK